MAALPLLAPRPAVAEPPPRPQIQAVALAASPQLDGDVLGDPLWAEVAPVRGFWQTRPFAGQAATEDTEVRLGYTGDTLFLAVVCFDREPSGIIVSDSRRDASLRDTDSFQVVFDTYRDLQSGFVFGTNPSGLEYDGQLANEGAGGGGGGRFFGGAGGGFNLNWDGAWRVAAKTGDFGWSAEFAIPFSTLRYPQGREQTWGVNFQRNIRRRNETSFWAPLDQQFDLYRLYDAGTLTGLSVPPQRNLKLIPYALATARRPGEEDAESMEDGEVGMDLKVSITPSLTLDLTYNTDFAQVEVDEQQVNLDRFNLFFPEKRPFFLENSGLFTVGAPGEAELFFSRRIGIGPEGEPVPIALGGRLSGKIGRTSIGLLDMQTESIGELAADNFGALRLRRDLAQRSNVGLLFVNRQGTGRLAGDDDYGRTFAVDGAWGIGEVHTLAGFAAVTETPGLAGDDHAYQLRYELNDPDWRAEVGYLEVAESFNPEVGFLARRAFRKPSFFVLRRIRPADLWGLHELRPHVSYRGFWDLDGFQETGFLHLDNHFEWRNGYELHTGINFTREGVKEAFEISPGVFVPPGVYEHEEAQLVFETNAGAPVSLESRAVIGGFFGGDRISVDATLRLRRGETLTSELAWSHNDVSLAGGDFEVNLGRLRVSYSFTPRLLLQALMQYNDRTDRTSVNLRFSWLKDANTGLFLVYNEVEEFGRDPELPRADRSLILKYSQLIDVFGRR